MEAPSSGTASPEAPPDEALTAETPFPAAQPPEEPVQETLQFVEPPPPEPPSREPLPSEPVAPLTALPTLEEMIPEDLRRKFIQVICGKDAEFYDLVIARLDEIQSWPQASGYLRELFEINEIDPFDETAIMFTNLVQHHCDQSRLERQ